LKKKKKKTIGGGETKRGRKLKKTMCRQGRPTEKENSMQQKGARSRQRNSEKRKIKDTSLTIQKNAAPSSNKKTKRVGGTNVGGGIRGGGV